MRTPFFNRRSGVWIRKLLRSLLFAMVFALCIPSIQSFQAIAADTDAIEAGKKAFTSAGPPWYDADSDGLKPLKVKETKEEERKDWKPDGPKWTWDWKWWPDFSVLGEVMRWLGWILLIGLVALIIYALVRAFMEIEPPPGTLTSRQLSPEEEAIQEARRIENLPTQVKAKKGNFLDVARELYQQGKFGEAIVYLFSHRLLQLDRAGYIRLTKGKTNRQYLTEIQSSKDLQKILGQTIVPFEDVFFGHHSLTKERFEGCWNRNDQFEQIIQEVSS